MAKRMCASRARDEYDLTEAELATLEVEYARNPHYRSAAPMRLYLISDLEAAAQAKRAAETAREEYEREHADEIAQARQAALVAAEEQQEALEEARRMHQAAVRAARKQRAEAAIGKWHKLDRGFEEADSGTGLSPDIWIQILMLLVDDLETEGVRGVSVVARDLCNARMLCKELTFPTQHVFKHLSNLCPAIRGPEKLWEVFGRDPFSLKVPQLKELAKTMQIRVSDPKAVLIVNLQQRVGITQPTTVPVNVVAAVKLEKDQGVLSLGIGQDASVRDLAGVSYNASVFSLRRACLAHGFASTSSLLEEAARRKLIRDEEERKRREEARKRRQREMQQKMEAHKEHIRKMKEAGHDIPQGKKPGYPLGLDRTCWQCRKNTAAKDCAFGLCGSCCPGQDCARHASYRRGPPQAQNPSQPHPAPQKQIPRECGDMKLADSTTDEVALNTEGQTSNFDGHSDEISGAEQAQDQPGAAMANFPTATALLPSEPRPLMEQDQERNNKQAETIVTLNCGPGAAVQCEDNVVDLGPEHKNVMDSQPQVFSQTQEINDCGSLATAPDAAEAPETLQQSSDCT